MSRGMLLPLSPLISIEWLQFASVLPWVRAEAFVVRSRVCLTRSVCGHKGWYLLPVLGELGKTNFETACVFLGLVIVTPDAFIPCEGAASLLSKVV